MINVSSEFKQAVADGTRKYLSYADITLANGRVLNLTNNELWEGGFGREDAVGDDNRFTALGSTIIGAAELSIKNQNEEYSSYDFTNAKVKTWIALEGIASSKVQTGAFTVDNASYTEASIRLSMLDNMEQFDRPYSNSSLSYPATLGAIVQDACLKCGVTLGTTTFPHYSFSIPTRPDSDGLTFREVIGMAAAIAGCFCRCSRDGKLELKWFDRTTLDAWRSAYSRGSTSPSSSYTGLHYFSSLFSQDVSVDDIVITGVQAIVEKTDPGTGKTVSTQYQQGSTGYVIRIEKNELLNMCDTAQINQAISWLGTQLRGLTFRKASISHTSNPTVEAGDIGVVWDRRNRGYPILITRTNFSTGNTQRTNCGAETPSRNAATRYGWQTKAVVESRKQLNAEIALREQMEKDLVEKINNSPGLYKTEVKKSGGGTDIYYHNLPKREESDIQILISAAGVTVTANGTDQNPYWYGLTVDGNMIANILSAIGVDADWINTGTIRSKDGSVQINLDKNTISIKGVTSFDGFVQDSDLGDYVKGTDLSTSGRTTINGSNITTGTIKDSNSNTVINLSTGELTMKKGSINIGSGTFQVSTSGALTMKSGSIDIGNGAFKVTTSGKMTCTGAEVSGDILSGSKSGNNIWMQLQSGRLKGGVGSSQYGYIEYAASTRDTNTGYTYNGIQIQGDMLRISTSRIAVARSSSVGTTATWCYNGDIQFVTSVKDNGDGTITWTYGNLRIINGFVVT